MKGYSPQTQFTFDRKSEILLRPGFPVVVRKKFVRIFSISALYHRATRDLCDTPSPRGNPPHGVKVVWGGEESPQ